MREIRQSGSMRGCRKRAVLVSRLRPTLQCPLISERRCQTSPQALRSQALGAAARDCRIYST